MEYHGKLYGKIGTKYFDTSFTSKDFDDLQKKDWIKINEIDLSKIEDTICIFHSDFGIIYDVEIVEDFTCFYNRSEDEHYDIDEVSHILIIKLPK